MTSPRHPLQVPAASRRGPRWARALLLILLSLLVSGIAAEVFRGAHAFSAEARSFRPRRGPVPPPPDAMQLDLQKVAFPGAGGVLLRGWYIPSKTGAAVLLCHGTDGDRRMMLRDARPLARGGIGVLLFDWPAHGESEGGPIHFGSSERTAVERAVDFLAARPDVDPRRLGAVGFSMGAYVLAQVAAHEARLRAVVLEGAFGDPDEQIRAEYERAGIAPVLGALIATRVGGMDVDAARPLDVIGRMAPRPLVFVAGSADATVPLNLSRRLYDAARQPKELWVIPRAGHGEYAAVDTAYGGRLLAFFAKALQGVPFSFTPTHVDLTVEGTRGADPLARPARPALRKKRELPDGVYRRP